MTEPLPSGDVHWLNLGTMPEGEGETREGYICYLSAKLEAGLSEFAGATFQFMGESIQVERKHSDVRH